MRLSLLGIAPLLLMGVSWLNPFTAFPKGFVFSWLRSAAID